MKTYSHDHDNDSDRLSDVNVPPVPEEHTREVLPSGPEGTLSIQASRIKDCDRLYVGYLSKRTDGVDRTLIEVEAVQTTDGGVLVSFTGVPPDREATKYRTDGALVWYITHDGQQRPIGTPAFLDIPDD